MSPQIDNLDSTPNLSIVNAERQVLPGPRLLHELVAKTSKTHSILDFLHKDGQRTNLTYGEFHRLTDQLSREIREHTSTENYSKGIIPVIIPQCPELYLAWVAVLKSGAAFCPVGNDVPPERLSFILRDVGATFVLATPTTSKSFGEVLSKVKCKVVSLTNLQAARRSSDLDQDHRTPRPTIDPSSPAYVMYTSGSTGLPKGVTVSHFSVSQSLLAHDEHIPHFKRFLQFASPTFDVSIFETFFPFFRRATLVGCERERMLTNLPATIKALDADAAELTPTVAGTLLRTREAAPCLKLLLTIGEMLTPQVISAFGGSRDQTSMLYAMYGPTEAAIHCTVASKVAADAPVGSIGRPLTTVTAFVLKEGKLPEIALVGEAGELAIAGQLADGYLNRPEENQAAFFSLDSYGSVYRTGDRAICRPNGNLEIMGRMVFGQVKLRGQRIELGEIEAIASKPPGVHLALASIIDDVLVLFCVTEQAVSASDIRAQCKTWLPPYMRPGDIIILEDDVPRLSSGKVDRLALEHNYRHRQVSGSPHDSSETPDEKAIVSILTAELGTKVGRNTSFWSLGIDSLKAIKIASKLRERFEFVNAAILADVDSIAELAKTLSASTRAVDGEDAQVEYETSDEWRVLKARLLPELDPPRFEADWTEVLPCSRMQIAMLVETAADEALNFNDVWLRLSTGVTFEAFRQAFDKLAAKNELLRSGFVSTDNQKMPFVRIVRPRLVEAEFGFLHPLQLSKGTSYPENEVHIRLHHALYDGWSWDLVMDDLNALLSGMEIPARQQFSYFCSFERQQLRSNRSEDLQYWQEKFRDFKPAPFPHLSSTHFERKRREHTECPLSVSYERLSEFASSLRCSREAIFEAAWSLVLASYVNESDIAIGVVSAGRHHPLAGIESVIGPCLSVFPLRVDIAALRTTYDLVSHVHRESRGFLKHGNLALRDIKVAAGILPSNKLFDTLCVWQQDSEDADRDRSQLSTVRSQDALDYALVLEFKSCQGSTYLRLTFDANRLPGSQAELLSRQLDSAILRILSHPECRLDSFWEGSDPSIMSVANSDFHRFGSSFELTSTISRIATLFPERVAIEFVHDLDIRTSQVEMDVLTYGELFKRASIVASALRRAHDISADDLVCLLGERSIQLYVGMLGVILAGAAYICIDPRTPEQRIRSILAEAKCKLVLTTEPKALNLDISTVVAATSIADLHAHDALSDKTTWPSPPGDSLAYAVFTSGSTGTPKGVLLTRRNLLSNLEELSRIYPCEPETDRLLQSCSPAFDVSVFEIFWCWHMGMTLCTASNDVLLRDLEHFVRTLKITHLSMTPSVAALVRADLVPGVKMLVTAGEPMNSKVFAEWADHGLYQGYGPSETTNICNVRVSVSQGNPSNNVGPPLPNTSLFVCERQMSSSPSATIEPTKLSPSDFKLVPKGGVGEIWIGGEQIGRGYIDAALTVKSFLQHPAYGWLYRSGDMGRILPDESLVIVGREDDQVKLRGQRMELGDINAAIVRCEGVQDATTLVLDKNVKGAARLVSFWTSYPDQEGVTAPSIYETLANTLPSYMIPDALIRIGRIPLTRQSKVDQRNIVALFQGLSAKQLEAASRGNTSSQDIGHFTEGERSIAAALSDVLGVRPETITCGTSFYSLGLDSISAIHVAKRLRARYPFLEISNLLNNPSIGQLDKYLSVQTDCKTISSPQDHLPQALNDLLGDRARRLYSQAGLEVEKVLPCTPLQESMAVTSTNSSSRGYQNNMRIEVRGDISRLRNAWEHALARHQILRTGIVETESTAYPLVQVVLANFQLPWVEEGRRKTRDPDLNRLMLPPWKLIVDRSSQHTIHVDLQMHHCLYDAEAMTILLSEVETMYHGHTLPSPVSFDRYLSFMRASDTDETFDYWRTNLDRAPVHKLSVAIRPDNRVRGSSLSIAHRPTSMTLSEFHRATRRLSCTPLSLLQSSWSRLLFLIFQCQDVCFGNVFSGRNLPINGIEHLIAPCFNTLPMRARVTRDASNHELCRILQQQSLEILPYQSSSLRRIQRELNTEGNALFDTLVLLQNGLLALDGRIWTLIEDEGNMPFPFILEVSMDVDTDRISLKLHSEVATETTLSQLLDTFDAILQHTTEYPQARVADYSTVTPFLPTLQSVSPVTVCRASSVTAPVNGPAGSDEGMSETETMVKDILVGLRPDPKLTISKDITIFNLGFDSITTVQILTRLRKQGINLSIGDVMEAASISNIARLCSPGTNEPAKVRSFDLDAYDQSYRASVCTSIGVDQHRVQHVWPCTPTQSGTLSQYLRSDRKLYFNSMHFELDSDVDFTRLRRAWAVAMEMHIMLRTGFAEVDDIKFPFAMIIYKTGAMQVPWSDTTSDFPQHHGDLQQLQWRIQVSRTGASTTLKLSMLHALYDAYSLNVILNDVFCLYRDITPEQVDIARTLSKVIGRSVDESSKSFWSRSLAGSGSTRFPDLRVYNNTAGKHNVANHWCRMPYKTLEEASAAAGATVQALVCAAWASLLSAYVAQSHVTFGVILSGRSFDDEENKVTFPCINTVPLAIEVPTNNVKLLREITKRCAGLMKHQHTPLNAIKRWSGIEGEFFDSVIVLQKYDSILSPQSPWTLSSDDAETEYAVSLEVLPREDGSIDLQLTFRDDIMPHEQAIHILQEYEAIVQTLAAPTATSSDLLETLLSVVPAKEGRIPTMVRYLHEFVEITARRKPTSIALEFVTSLEDIAAGKYTWTYSELDANGDRMAQLIQLNGAQVGDLVAVCFDKCPEASFAILGVLKAGCGYLAIDPGAPMSRKRFILEDAGCEIVLTTSDKLSDFSSSPDVTVLAIDNSSWQKFPAQALTLERGIAPEDTCYCLYTSGTTGTPKGCLISHDSAVQAMLSFQRIFEGRWNESSRWLQFASFHFDVSILEQFWSWSVGICVTSAPRDLLFEDLPGTISALKITHLDLTPSLARLLTPETVPGLRDGVFIVGGEQVRQDILEVWGDTGCLYNFYGPSEVTIGCTVHRQVRRNAKATNIGQQWDNVGSFVLEPESQRPVLRGAIGELCLSGPLVGKGYLNRSDLTAEKFVTLKDYNTRVYRTGDLVRLLHDNSFEFLGRIDDQVNLRGQRLEIGEINHLVLTANAGIKNVATMVLNHSTQHKDHLVTFFSTAQHRAKNQDLSILTDRTTRAFSDRIWAYCNERLPAYMVPTYILAVSSLPLSVNNKIDHKLLKALYEKNLIESAENVTDNQGTANGTETVASIKAVEILAAFLQIPQSTIKSTSRLFELGLDSISAIGLTRAFRRQGFDKATVATVLRHSVVKDLVRALDLEPSLDEIQAVNTARQTIRSFSDNHSEAIARILGCVMKDIEHIAPCTPLQEGMISRVIQSHADDTIYFSCFRFELRPGTNVSRLEAAWKAAQRSVSVLRTFFVSTADGYAQVVLRECENGVRTTAGTNNKTEDQAFSTWVKSVKSLATVLPWKVELETFESGGLMTLCIFHGLYDGNGLCYLLGQIKRCYNHPRNTVEPLTQFYEALPHGPLRQAPDEKEFWRCRFPSFKPLGLPPVEPQNETQEPFFSLKHQVVLNDLQRLCTELDITTLAFFQALLLYTLHVQFEASPSMGVVVSGRAVADSSLEDVIGPMFNTIPFAINGLQDNATLADLVRACYKFNVDTLPYQHTPLRKIARFIDQDIHQGLFDVLFVFQRSSEDVQSDGLWKDIPTTSSPDYPLNVEVEQTGSSFLITLVGKADHLRKEDAKRLFDDYVDIIRNADMASVVPDVFWAHSTASAANQLPVDGQTDSEGAVDREAGNPLNDVEMMIRSQVAQLASVRETVIGRHRPTIFELGLDSIEAMKLAARLRNVDLRVAVSAIMKAPTVAGIAQSTVLHVQSDGAAASSGRTTDSIAKMQSIYRAALQHEGIDLSKVEYVFPVTPMQEGLLIESEKYRNIMTFRLNPDTDVQRLKAAWESISRSEPILRTRFASVEIVDQQMTLLQYVLKQAFPILSLTGSTLTEILDQFEEVTAVQDLSDQKVQAAVVEAGNTSFLVLAMPHALYDAWSLHLLHQQVAKAYQQQKSRLGESALVRSRRHLEQVMTQSVSTATRAFWNECLTDIRPTVLETDMAKNERVGGAFLLRKQSTADLAEVLEFCRSQGVTLQSLALACWAIALAHETSQLDVCFGVILSGRTTEVSEQLIFPTFNTVIFRPDMNKDSTRAQTIRQVHDAIIRASEYQHFSLREALKVVREQGIEGEIFNTLFTFQKLPTATDDLAALYKEVMPDEVIINPPYAVNVELEGGASGLVWTMACQDGIAGPMFAHALLAKLEKILATLIKQPHQPLIEEEGRMASVCRLSAIEMYRNDTPELTETQDMNNDNAKSPNRESWTSSEKIVKNVLADIAKVDKEHITKRTGIFHLGLDSVSAIKVASFLRKQGISLPVSGVIREQTVEKIAALADRLKSHAEEAHRVLVRSTLDDSASQAVKKSLGIPEAHVEGVIPATAGQLYMLDMWSASSGRLFYPRFRLKVSGCSREAFDQAANRLVKTVPLLRTLFVDHKDSEQQQTWQVVLKHEAVDHFELPWQMCIGDHGNDLFVSFQIHHALYDAVSLHLLIAQLERLCNDVNDRQQLNTNMANFVSTSVFPRTMIQNFWTKYIDKQEDVSPPIARGTFAAARIQKFEPRLLSITKLTDQLKHHGLAIQALFFAAYARLYSHLRRQPITLEQESNSKPKSIVLGIYLSNRSLDIDGITHLAAPTFNIIPIRIQVDAQNLLESALQVQRDLAKISKIGNCGTSMREIFSWTGIKIDTFVNFLSLPSDDESVEDSGNDGVRITHAELDPEGNAAFRDSAASSPFLRDTDKRTIMTKWCLPAIDIEAKVEDGNLAVGVFAPEDMISEEEVIKMMDDMRSLMLDFC